MTLDDLIDLDDLVDRIDVILPQTQCRQCTYAGCRPYAEALARGEADIDQCPPGGEEGVRALADLLGVAAKPLNPAHGVAKPRAVALIDEARCIGCTLCIKACPVDAILGAAKRMHTVFAGECTGCELCIAPCPVDCIVMRPIEAAIGSWRGTERAEQARRRYHLRLARLAREETERAQRLAARQASVEGSPVPVNDAADGAAKRAAIAAAVLRVREKKAQTRAAEATVDAREATATPAAQPTSAHHDDGAASR